MKLDDKILAQKIERMIWLAVVVSIAVWSIFMQMDGRNQKVFMGVLTIIALLAVSLWQKKSKHSLPSAFVSMVYVFIFISVGLGTFGGGYKVNHFDDALHLMSGVWTGYGGWIILELIVGKKLAEQLPKRFVVFYVIVFALAVAGSWELLEFAGDKLFHFTAQGRDHDDTMYDMIDGLIGGTFIALFIASKHGDHKFTKRSDRDLENIQKF